MDNTVRKILIVAAVAFALAAPALQAVLGFGLSASEFASQGDSTLRAAGYGFSIWSVIYAGFVAYAVYQALPRNDGSPLMADLAAPSVVAIAGCGGWILASAFDARWLSVAIIITSAVTLTVGLATAGRRADPSSLGERLFVWWPLGLLAGWLTIAAALNVLTVMTAEGLLGELPQTAAFAGIVAVLIAALFVLRATHLVAYGVPIAWGLVAVWVAEKATKSDVAALALGAAILVGAYSAWQARPPPRLR
jgi:hypothetical protein